MEFNNLKNLTIAKKKEKKFQYSTRYINKLMLHV